MNIIAYMLYAVMFLALPVYLFYTAVVPQLASLQAVYGSADASASRLVRTK